jgi:hypothetical protein
VHPAKRLGEVGFQPDEAIASLNRTQQGEVIGRLQIASDDKGTGELGGMGAVSAGTEAQGTAAAAAVWRGVDWDTRAEFTVHGDKEYHWEGFWPPLRVAPGQCIHIRMAAAASDMGRDGWRAWLGGRWQAQWPLALRGRWWLQDGSRGSLWGVACLVEDDEELMPLVLVAGGPWLLQESDMLCSPCTTVKVTCAGQVEARNCSIGGLSEECRATDAVQVNLVGCFSGEHVRLRFAGQYARAVRLYDEAFVHLRSAVHPCSCFLEPPGCD